MRRVSRSAAGMRVESFIALMPAALRDTRRMNQFVSIAAAVAGLLFGLDIGVIAGALPFITDHFTLSSRLQEWGVRDRPNHQAIFAPETEREPAVEQRADGRAKHHAAHHPLLQATAQRKALVPSRAQI